MTYIILEIQKYYNGAVVLGTPATYASRDTAEQVYHTTLAYAAVSNVSAHTVIMLNDTGDKIKGETYYHSSEPEPSPEE